MCSVWCENDMCISHHFQTPGCAGGFEIMTGRIRRANANIVQEASTEKSPSSKVVSWSSSTFLCFLKICSKSFKFQKPKKVGSPQVSYEEELNRKTRELFGGVTYRDKVGPHWYLGFSNISELRQQYKQVILQPSSGLLNIGLFDVRLASPDCNLFRSFRPI